MTLIDLYQSLNKKSTKWDGYFDVFETYLKKYVCKFPKILELGVANGGSLELWNKYFVNAEIIIGVDGDKNCSKLIFEEDNVKVLIGLFEDEDFLSNLINTYGMFDVIIDDGGHTNSQQLGSLAFLFPFLKYGGTYIIEDTHTSYWSDYGGGFQKTGSTIETSKTLIDFLNQQFINDRYPNDYMKKIFKGLKSISYYNSMIIMTKDLNTEINPISSGDF